MNTKRIINLANHAIDKVVCYPVEVDSLDIIGDTLRISYLVYDKYGNESEGYGEDINLSEVEGKTDEEIAEIVYHLFLIMPIK